VRRTLWVGLETLAEIVLSVALLTVVAGVAFLISFGWVAHQGRRLLTADVGDA